MVHNGHMLCQLAEYLVVQPVCRVIQLSFGA